MTSEVIDIKAEHAFRNGLSLDAWKTVPRREGHFYISKYMCEISGMVAVLLFPINRLGHPENYLFQL